MFSVMSFTGYQDLAAFASLVARGLRPDADDRRDLVEPEVAAAPGQGFRDPETGSEHYEEGLAGEEAGCGHDEGVSFFGRK